MFCAKFTILIVNGIVKVRIVWYSLVLIDWSLLCIRFQKSKDKYDQDVFVVTCEENFKENIERLVKRFFFLAYNASGIMGMGMFQARDNQTEDQIWDSVHNDKWNTRKGEPYGDYIFGRMVKTGCKFDETSMTVVDRQPTADYQSWVRQYPSYEALLSAAISSIEKDETPATSPVDFDELIQAAEYLSKVEPPRIVPLDINTLDQMFEAK